MIGTVDDLGRTIERARLDQGLTQAQLAALAGVSRRWLGQVESGHPGAQIDKILFVLRALGLRLDVSPAPVIDNSALEALVAHQEW